VILATSNFARPSELVEAVKAKGIKLVNYVPGTPWTTAKVSPPSDTEPQWQAVPGAPDGAAAGGDERPGDEVGEVEAEAPTLAGRRRRGRGRNRYCPSLPPYRCTYPCQPWEVPRPLSVVPRARVALASGARRAPATAEEAATPAGVPPLPGHGASGAAGTGVFGRLASGRDALGSAALGTCAQC
jgi:hypothetical protein